MTVADPRRRAVLIARLRAMGASHADAEDCAQEALTAGWSRVVAGDRTGARLAWLITVARDRYVDTVYRRARETSIGLVPDGVADRAAEGPEERVVRRVEAGYLITQLYRLPPVTQTVCLLIGRGMDRKVVARKLRLSVRSVESHLTRARRYLRTRGTLGVVLIAGATAVDAARRAVSHRMAAAALAAVSTGIVLLPAADNPRRPPQPVIAAPPVPSGEHGPPPPVPKPLGAPSHVAPGDPLPPARPPATSTSAPAPPAAKRPSVLSELLDLPVPLPDLGPVLAEVPPALPPLPRLPEPIGPVLGTPPAVPGGPGLGPTRVLPPVVPGPWPGMPGGAGR